MYDQSLTEYRQILSDIKTDLGWNKLQPEDKNQEDLVRGILLLARNWRPSIGASTNSLGPTGGALG